MRSILCAPDDRMGSPSKTRVRARYRWRLAAASLAAGGLLSGLSSASVVRAAPGAQVEVDRIVARIGGRIITQSDIKQARLLRLVDDWASDESTRRGLEDRLLMQNEMSRAGQLAPPTDAELASAHAAWEARVGGGAGASKLLAEAGMGEDALRSWLREDLRVRAYLARQFGMLPESARGRATTDWLARLRQRADVR